MTLSPTSKQRYKEAHRIWFQRTYINAYADGHYFDPIIPDTRTANGLNRFIVKYLDYCGYYSNRINTTGRKIFDKRSNRERWIKGTTRNGTGDTQAVVAGKFIVWETKIKDKPSPEQLREQERVTKSGGYYFFVHNAEEFFMTLDKILGI